MSKTRRVIFTLLLVMVIMVIVNTSVYGGWKANLLKNPSFEETVNGSPAAWNVMHFDPAASTFTVAKGPGHSGRSFVTIISHKANDARYTQTVPVSENKLYKITAWVKTENVGKKELGANISIESSLVTSISLTGNHRRWKCLELFVRTGTGVKTITVTLGLGGYGSINTGKVSFDDVRMEEVEGIPVGSPVATAGTIDETQPVKYVLAPLHLFFDIWLKIALLVLMVIALMLIYQDLTRKQGLYFSGKLYLLLALVFLVFFLIYQRLYSQITTHAVQLFFVILVVMAIGYAVYLRKAGKWQESSLIYILIFLGIGVRLCYFLYTTGFELRQHDVAAHMQYVTHLIKYWSMPPSGEYQMFHPPLHHTIVAIIISIGKLFNCNDFMIWRLIQTSMVFFGSLILIFFYKIMKQLGCGTTAKVVGVAIFAFHPANIYMSLFANNDNTLYFFYIVAFYFLIRWLNEPTMRNVIWLAIFVSLGVLTKKSALVLLALIASAVLYTWFKNRPHLKTYLKQAATFLLITVPSASVYQLRNYILFHQGLGYLAPGPFELLSNNPATLFGISFKNLFQNPFTIPPFTDMGKNAENFLEYLFKSSLFGEWQFPGLEVIAVILVAVALLNWVNLILLLGYYYLRKNRQPGSHNYLFWINIVLLCGLLLKLRIDNPIVCNQNFRYLTPLMISIPYLWGQAVQFLVDHRKTVWQYISLSLAAAFCVIAAVFILMIGMP